MSPDEIAVIVAVMRTRITECDRVVATFPPGRPAAERCKKHGELCKAALESFQRVTQGDLQHGG